MKTLDQLKVKAAGDLVYAQDWIDLVDNVQAMDQRLQDLVSSATETLRNELREEIGVERRRIDDLTGRMDDAHLRLGSAETEIGALRSDLDPLRNAYRRVTLETSRSRSSIGELIELTGRVTDLSGNPLLFADAAARPWIDFLVSWGQLKPVPGFTSRGDPGDRSIAVQVDAEGIARVNIKAEHADEISNEEEDEVAATLSTRLPQREKALGELILEANTPMEAKGFGVFQTLSQEYDRRDSLSLRKYVDSYYVRNVERITGRTRPIFRHRWRDYHSTVVALLKDDNIPTTADSGRGFASIQVTFRDWIGPWIQIGYLDDLRPRIDVLRERLQPKIGPRYDDTLVRFREEVRENMRDRGVLGRYRELGAFSAAMDELQPQEQPGFYHGFVRAMQDGLKVQRSLLVSQSLAEDDDDDVLFTAISQTVASSDTNSELVRDQLLGELEARAVQVEHRVLQASKLEQQRFQEELLAEDGRVRQVERFVDTVGGQLTTLQALNVTEVQTGLSEIVGLKNRLIAVEGRG